MIRVIAVVSLAWLTTVAAADPAHRIAVDVRCAAAVDRDQLLAALAIELAGSGWTAGSDGAYAIGFTIDASPCTATAPIELIIDGASTETARYLGPIELAPAARARGLALLIAETVPELARTRAAPAVGATTLATEALQLDAVAQRDDSSSGIETALAFVRRWYLMHPDQVATGARLTVSHALPARWLRAGVDLGGDQIATPFGYQMFAARAGLQLGARFAAGRRVAIDVTTRGEILAAYVDAITGDMIVTTRWVRAAGAGGVIAAAIDLSPSLSARVEIEAAAVLAADDITRGWNLPPSQAPPPDMNRAFSSSLGLSLGLSIR